MWYVLEGRTAPDVYIETPDALIVVEGKRTEAGPTTATKWMAQRHQMWRHIDAAWEVRGRRKVLGFFIVEGEGLGPPQHWREACTETMAEAALSGSFPHRDQAEIEEIQRCFLGVTTWQQVCITFGLAYEALPDRVPQTAP